MCKLQFQFNWNLKITNKKSDFFLFHKTFHTTSDRLILKATNNVQNSNFLHFRLASRGFGFFDRENYIFSAYHLQFTNFNIQFILKMFFLEISSWINYSRYHTGAQISCVWTSSTDQLLNKIKTARYMKMIKRQIQELFHHSK